MEFEVEPLDAVLGRLLLRRTLPSTPTTTEYLRGQPPLQARSWDEYIGRCAKASSLPPDTQQSQRLGTYMPGSNKSFSLAMECARRFGTEPGFRQLTLFGPPGTGKTHLARALAWDWVEIGAWVIYRQVRDLLTELGASYEDDADLPFAEFMEHLKSCHLLVLEDLGVHRTTEWAVDVLDEIVDWRYGHRLPILVTTNMAAEDIPARIADRLCDVHQGVVVLLKGPSYRRGHRP